VDIVVVDSVAALVPKAELEGDMGDPQMGLQARLMSQALRKLTGIVSKSRTCLIFIQPDSREDRRDVRQSGNNHGGRALKFYASMRVDIRRIQAIKEGDKVVGSAHARESGEEQGCRAVPRSGIRHCLRRRHLARRRLIDLGVEKGVLEKAARGSALAASAWARPRKRACLPEGKQGHSRQAGEHAAEEAEIPVPGHSNAAAPGPNGHAAAPASSDKSP